MTNPMLAELDAQAKWLRQAASEIAKEGNAGWGNTCTQAAECIERNHATIADMAKRLEAAERDAAEIRALLRKTTAAAVTALFAEHQDDVLAAFELPDLQRILTISQPLAESNVRVEAIYRKAWDAATQEGEG